MFTASAISSVGDGVLVTAAPLLAVSVTTNAVAIAGVRLAAALPWLMFGLVSGVAADRVQRQRLMRLVDLVRAFILIVTALLTLAHLAVLAVVYVTVFLLGSGQTLFDSASQALVAQVISADGGKPAFREKANSWLMSAETVGTTLLGPPLGSMLFAWQGVSPFALDALSFLISAVLLYGVRISRTPPLQPTAGNGTRAIVGEVRQGLSWIRRNRILRHQLVIMSVTNLATGMQYGILVLYATRILHLSARSYGFLLTAMALGGLLATVLVSRMYQRWNTGVILRASIAVTALTQLGQGLTQQPWFAFCMAAGGGFGIMAWNAGSVSERQRQIPAELLGRTVSAFRLAGRSCQGIGMLAGGIAAASFTLRLPIVAGAVIVGAVAVAPGALWQAGQGSASANHETSQ